MARPARTDVLIGALAALFGAAGDRRRAGPARVASRPRRSAPRWGSTARTRSAAPALAVAAAAALVPTGDLAPAPADPRLRQRLRRGPLDGRRRLGGHRGRAAGGDPRGRGRGPTTPTAGSCRPILLVGTAWIAGRAIRERDLVAARLAERAEELEREREEFAALSVRYERARIASELHDIVAHAISVMVVQAGAGQRIAAIDPELTGETFEAIAGAARQAERDMTQLVALLADDDAIGARARPHPRRGAGRARGRDAAST